ncbi:nuclear transport factor 2 family protein [Williamsia sp.]|uniref:nuclear transport factor 2 family protein n=1 Tax=Williamsia sp. TaxID=1872085 RepID=UPI002F942785
MDIQEVIDRLEIEEHLTKYAKAVDSEDWDLWRSLYTEDARIDYSAVGGPTGNRVEISAWLEASMKLLPMKQHFITNIDYTITGDTAEVRAMFYNPMILPGQTEKSDCGGWYRHQLVRTPEGWRTNDFQEEDVWFSATMKAGADADRAARERKAERSG